MRRVASSSVDSSNLQVASSSLDAIERPRRRIRKAVVAVSLLSAIGAMASVVGAQAASATQGAASKATHCTALTPLPSAPSTSSGSANSVAVTVEVPAVVGLTLNAQGVPQMARSNTTAAPACGDVFVIFSSTSSTSFHQATLKQVNAAMALTTGGGWKIGVWNSLA